jgi:hypothetical protein
MPVRDARPITWEGRSVNNSKQWFKIEQRRRRNKELQTTLYTYPHGPVRLCADMEEAKIIAEFLAK